MKLKKLIYVFVIALCFSFTIWIVIKIIMINTITYNQVYMIDESCNIELMNQNIYINGNNIRNQEYVHFANLNMWLTITLACSIIGTIFFIILFIQQKKKQRKQIRYSLINI